MGPQPGSPQPLKENGVVSTWQAVTDTMGNKFTPNNSTPTLLKLGARRLRRFDVQSQIRVLFHASTSVNARVEAA
jgi:hypothetical protein